MFRTLGWNLVLAGSVLLFCAVSASGALVGVDGAAIRAVLGVVAAVLLAAAARIVRAAIVVDDRAVTVRGLARSHHLPWERVTAVTTARPGKHLKVSLADGREIAARGCASYSRAKLERLAAEIESLRPAG